MAYMHRETFDIAQNLDPFNPDRDDVYFEADDLIAPAIQVLNRKGYITEQCCSGHPFDTVMDGAIDRDFHICSGISFKEGISLPSLPPGFELYDVKRHISTRPEAGAAEIDLSKIDINELQIAFWINHLIIERFYDESDDAYAVFRDILDAMEQLYKWALELPDYNQ